MNLRHYSPDDIWRIIEIFEGAVNSVCSRDYSPGQRAAWIEGADAEKWNARFMNSYTLVAEECGKIVAFGNIADGYVDMLYTAEDFQGRGAATLICDALEKSYEGNIYADVSITAKDFFSSRGYETLKRQKVLRRGAELDNFVMVKRRGSGLKDFE